MTAARVRPAEPADVAGLPALQVAAGALFREIGMADVASGPAPSVAELDEARRSGDLLVAVVGERVAGFVRTRPLDSAIHVEQVSVAPADQRRGVGRALMLAAEQNAADRGFDRMTLTTFRDVAFNGPFYRALGWVELDADGVTPGLAAERAAEAAAGLDRWPRVAMGKRVG